MKNRKNNKTKLKENIEFISKIAVVIVSIIGLFLTWLSIRTSREAVNISQEVVSINQESFLPNIWVQDNYITDFEILDNDDGTKTAVYRSVLMISNTGEVDTSIFAASVKAEDSKHSNDIYMSDSIKSLRTATLGKGIIFYGSIWNPVLGGTKQPDTILKNNIYNGLPILLKSHSVSYLYVDLYFQYSPSEFEFLDSDGTNPEPITVMFVLQFPDSVNKITSPKTWIYYKQK